METIGLALKQIVESTALYIPIIIAILGMIKYVKVALDKQKKLLQEIAKLQELVTLALSDKYIDPEEIRAILISLKQCQELGMDTLDAYKDAYDKLVDLINKFKTKRLKAERRQKV